MADSVNFYTAEAEDIARRRKMAEMMQQQALSPIEQPHIAPGGFAVRVSPYQGLAKVLQAGIGAYGERKAAEESKALTAKRGEAMASAMQGMPQPTQKDSWQGTSEPGDAPVNTPYTVQPTMQDNAQWLGKLSNLGPDAVAMGGTMLGMQQKGYENEENRATRLSQTAMQLEARAQDRQLSIEARAQAQQQAEALRREMATQQQTFAAQQKDSQQLWQSNENRQRAADRSSMAGAFQRAVPTAIADPNNPSATIIVNANNPTQVIGKGPKLTQTGTAEQKLSLNLPQAKQRIEQITLNMDRLSTAMSELHDDKGLSNITGTIAGRTPNLTNTATGAQNKLDSIKSQIFQSSLQAMREASKTGGAVGNVSDREGDKLERTLAGLNQSAGTADFKKELKKAIEQVRRSKEIIQNAFDEQYSGVQSDAPQNNAPPQRRASDRGGMPDASAIDAEIARRRGGRP